MDIKAEDLVSIHQPYEALTKCAAAATNEQGTLYQLLKKMDPQNPGLSISYSLQLLDDVLNTEYECGYPPCSWTGPFS